MNSKDIRERLSFILNVNGSNFKIYRGADGIPAIRIDLHGYTCQKARTTIKNILVLLSGFDYRLEVIHGFKHGNSLKTMLRDEITHPRIIRRFSGMKNPGVTNLVIAA